MTAGGIHPRSKLRGIEPSRLNPRPVAEAELATVYLAGSLTGVNLEEIKLQLERMSAAERSELESFLKAKRVTERASHKEMLEAAQRRMDAGEAISSAELRALLTASEPSLARDWNRSGEDKAWAHFQQKP